MELFIKGLIVGLAISAPMGSVGVFVIHRVIAHDRVSGLTVGLGSLVADLIFGMIAIYGLTAIGSLVTDHGSGLRLLGGILLLYISINIFFSKPKEKVVYDAFYTFSKDFATGFILTITNPLTIIAVLALFAWFGLNGSATSLISATILLLGLASGLVLWWLGLTGIANHFKKKIRIPSFRIINQSFGVILFILAILILVKVL